jgi:hypothetical protein
MFIKLCKGEINMTKNFNSKPQLLDSAEEDDNGFIDGEVSTGKPIMFFNFASEPVQAPQPAVPAKASFGKLSFHVSQRGSTPAVDGEAFTLKRCYQFRPSTLRKLNELKAQHQEVNVYLNTIIDEAISHYHEHIFSHRKTS